MVDGLDLLGETLRLGPTNAWEFFTDGGGGQGEKVDAKPAAAPPGSTPAGRPYTKHGAEQAAERGIPGEAIDETIDNYPGVAGEDGKTVHYNPSYGNYGLTVVTGTGGAVVTVHEGQPPRNQLPQ